jgi:hypothetical protein
VRPQGAAQLRAAGNERDRWTQEQRRQHTEWAEEKQKWARQHNQQAGQPTPATPTPRTNHQAPATTGTNRHLAQADGNPQAGGAQFQPQTPQQPQQLHDAAGNGFFGGAGQPHVGLPQAASLSPSLNFTLEEEF